MSSVRRVAPEEFAGRPAGLLEEIVAACHAGDARNPLDEAARLRLRHHGLEGSALWLADQGFALLRGSAAPGEVWELDLAVAPAARRGGVGRALATAALDGLGLPADEADDDDRSPAVVRAWSHGDHPGAAALARELGFERARELHVLRRPLAAPDGPDAGPQPDPRIRSWRPSDATELLRVNAAAFADHPEQGSLDEAGLAERMAEPWFDPEGLLVAVDGDRILGFHWTKLHEGRQGEVYVLAVDPAAQGLGLGRALTAAGLAHLASRGARSVHLYVEATNAAALALYRGQGFRPNHTHVQYERG